ncbi:tyrosine-type recombinase/integrase [Paenibacillus azoreducens]|uniref:tyrosine-type recombinase/integrase n=1 Tax=Paenibacillus azoreducens TaxID=116718 RepID=UPI0039F4FB3C
MASFQKVPANNKQGYKWICIMDGPPDPVTGKRNQISRRGDTKKEAEERAKNAIDALHKGLDLRKAKNLTFEDVSREWLKTYSKRKVKIATVVRRQKDIDLLLKRIAKVNIRKFSHKQYQNIINELDDEEYARNTIAAIHTTTNMIMKYAIKNNIIVDNPCSDVVIPEKKLTVEEIENTTIEDKYFEKNELSDFLSAVIRYGLPMDKERFYLLAFSGMRPGELCALKWSDLNFETNEIRITKTLYNPNNNMKKYMLTPPKTKGSIRTFNLDEKVMKLLAKHREKQKKSIKEFKGLYGKEYHDENFVFCHANGYPFLQINVLNRMKRILRLASIKKSATPHIFRHTHISMLAEAEVDLKTVMRRVGHDDPKTTLKIYTHVTDKMKKDANEKIRSHFADLLNFKL